jgi:hypothetical protein
MILDYLWRYPPYIILLIMVDVVSVSYPPVSLIPWSLRLLYCAVGGKRGVVRIPPFRGSTSILVA